MNKVVNSPLKYPGGKHWLFKTLQQYIPEDTKEVISPFFGGGALEINLALKGIQVYGYDICPYLVNFWQYWLKDPGSIEQAAKKILATHTLDTLKNIKKNFDYLGHKGAVLYYVCNRLSFGGMTLHGSYIKPYELVNGHFVYPMYKGQTRRRHVFPFSELWEAFPPVSMTVREMGFQNSLLEHPGCFAYLDPPYVETERLYGIDSFDHEGLAEILTSRKNWALSYSNRPLVRQLYDGYYIETIPGRNFKTGKMTSTELLILSHDLA